MRKEYKALYEYVNSKYIDSKENFVLIDEVQMCNDFELQDKYSAFGKYIIEGGMAGSYLYKEQESKYDYITEVFDTLIVRDIRKKYKIRNTQLMDRVVDFLMDNISNLSSVRSIPLVTKRRLSQNGDYANTPR